MRILITGGGGFLGSELVVALAKSRKNRIQVVDSFTHGFPKKPFKRKNIEPTVVANISNYYGLIGPMEKFKPDVVIHLAAHISRPETFGDFRACANENYVGTANVAQACMSSRIKPKKLIFASTLSAKEPVMHFGIAKQASERLLESIFPRFPQFGVQLSVLRFAELYGNSASYTSSSLVSFLVDSMILNQNIAIHGVKAKKDFLHVGDAVKAIQLALEYEDGPLTRLDIGTGQEVVIKDLIDKLRGLTNYQGQLHFREDIRVPVEDEIADPAPAEKLLGFKAEADLDQELTLLISKRKKALR